MFYFKNLLCFFDAPFTINKIVIIKLKNFQIMFRNAILMFLLFKSFFILFEDVAVVMVFVELFPWLSANITKILATSSWRPAFYIVAAKTPLNRIFTKWTLFCIYFNPKLVSILFQWLVFPTLGKVARTRPMNFIFTIEAKL